MGRWICRSRRSGSGVQLALPGQGGTRVIRLAALAAMALVLGGCEGVECAGTTNNNCQDPHYAERLQANREKMSSHFRELEDRPFKGAVVQHDDARGVTCWVPADPRAGLSCLPDWMIQRPSIKPDKCLVKDLGKSEACRKLFDELDPEARP